MDKNFKLVGRSLDVLIGAIVLIIAFVSGYIIDRQFAVVTDVKIDYIQSESPLDALIGGSFRKVRDCDFDHLKFYKGERGDRAVTVKHEFLEGNKIRKTGEHGFGDWRVRTNHIEFRDEVYADTWHQCYLTPRFAWGKRKNGKPKMWGIPFPWLTKSRFYR